MKRRLIIGSLVVAFVALVAFTAWRLELRWLRSPQSTADETGLRLPDHARIIATRSHVFSIADGVNYEWLIQSDTSLLPWAASNMKLETGGWEHIRQLSELGFKDEMPKETRFGGVWKGFRRNVHGTDETSYLYLAQDGRVGILSTFRP